MSLRRQLADQLQELQRQNLRRRRLSLETAQSVKVRVDGQVLSNFCSNDYLGLANHPRVIQAAKNALDQWGAGSGASHLVCGHTALTDELEQGFAQFVGAERALLFSTGYMANLGVVSSFTDRNDQILEDKLNHASLIDAARLSRATLSRWNHTNLEHLDGLLQRSRGNGQLLFASDTVFSMDGDLAPLPELVKRAEQEDAILYLDDAHGIGVLGQSGRGSLSHFGLQPGGNLLLMATLSKALGNFGALVAGDELLIETLIQKARPYIYTTALPPSVVAGALEAMDLLRSESWRQDKLIELIDYFRKSADSRNLQLMPSSTAIQPLVVGDNHLAMTLSDKLREAGFLVTAIRPPTVPVGTARLRITLSAEHEFTDLDALLDCLESLVREASP